VSIRSAWVAALGAATLVMPLGVAALVSASASSASAVASPTIVDLRQPQNLPLGGPPRAAYLDRSTRSTPIVRPQKTPLPVGWSRGVEQLTRVRGGYTVAVLRVRVRFIGDDGRRKDLLHVAPPAYVADTVASRDGRFLAITLGSTEKRHHQQILVKRISDGKRVAQRAFNTPQLVASLTGRRALLTTNALPYARHWMPPVLTRWWNLRTNRLHDFDNAGRPGAGYDGMLSSADLTSGQVALLRGDHERLVTIPRRSALAWRTRPHEWVLSWSPDDRYVLTVTATTTPLDDRSGDGWDSFAIRRADGGALVTRFQGYQNLYADRLHWSPVWESRSTFVFEAGYGCTGAPGEFAGCPSHTLLRCTIHGACEQIAEPAGYIGAIQERRTPPS
jgi:hypothetical protein